MLDNISLGLADLRIQLKFYVDANKVGLKRPLHIYEWIHSNCSKQHVKNI